MDSEHLYMKHSEISGYGIFTKIKRNKGDVVSNILQYSKTVHFPSKYSIQVGITEHIEANGLVALLNHSCDPNCIITNNYDLQTIKHIEENLELTYNYLTTEYDLEEKFSCLCGTEKCIRRIAGYKYYEGDDIRLIWNLIPL